MKVLDHEPNRWFLLEQDGRLYLDAHCSHSFVDYDFVMELSEAELRQFREEGRDYLDRLSYDIHYSAPALRISRSPFKQRNLTTDLGGEVREAVALFRLAQPD